MRSSFQLLAIIAIVAGLTFSSCGGEESPTGSGASNDENAAPKPKAQGSSVLKVGDKLFNLPSPLETAMLIEEVGGDFYEDMLNPNTDATQYSVKNLQAMNLGVYGADLGYCLIYNQSQKAFRLLATTKKLGTDLGISPALYSDLIKRFEGNMENKDSLLIFVSELNRLSDEYLKENESEDVSAMILYGGWLESLYFMTSLSSTLHSPELRERVGEQKNTIENLIGLIEQQNVDGSFDELLAELKDLKVSFDKVGSTYEYVEAETNPDQMMTVIKSKSSATLDDALLSEIAAKIAKLRNRIISTTAS
ncbi:MAG: hypothetical protein RLP15_01775 [Cryomorphaceae bacterium]